MTEGDDRGPPHEEVRWAPALLYADIRGKPGAEAPGFFLYLGNRATAARIEKAMSDNRKAAEKRNVLVGSLREGGTGRETAGAGQTKREGERGGKWAEEKERQKRGMGGEKRKQYGWAGKKEGDKGGKRGGRKRGDRAGERGGKSGRQAEGRGGQGIRTFHAFLS